LSAENVERAHDAAQLRQTFGRSMQE